MEQKIATLSSVKVLDEALGIVEAYTNTMGSIDLDNDIIEPQAFDTSIQQNLPIPALVGHDANAVVGKVIAARSMPVGDGTSRLYTRIQFNLDTGAGRDAFSRPHRHRPQRPMTLPSNYCALGWLTRAHC